MIVGVIFALILFALAGAAFLNATTDLTAVAGGVLTILAIVSGVGGFYYGPQYDVWQQGMAGKAALTRAEQDRQIKVEEAKAGYESSKLNAQAEVERAKGAAEANKIMAESLGGPDRYLRWRWIVMLENNEHNGINREIIYVPADGNLPMSEAGRAVQPPLAKPN